VFESEPEHRIYCVIFQVFNFPRPINIIIIVIIIIIDRLCGLVVRLAGYHIFWEVVGLERGALCLVSTTEELLDRKVAAPV
jgi:hypothetical protein